MVEHAPVVPGAIGVVPAAKVRVPFAYPLTEEPELVPNARPELGARATRKIREKTFNVLTDDAVKVGAGG